MKPPTNFNGLQFEREHGVTCWIDENGDIATNPTVTGLAAKVTANVAAETDRQARKAQILSALGITADELSEVLNA